MKINIEITGLPGSGKSTLVKNLIKNEPKIFYDRFDLALKPYKYLSRKRKLFHLLPSAIKYGENLFFQDDINREQDKFSKNYPDFYGAALNNLEVIIQSGFVPSSFWLRWYFNAWLLNALASRRDNIFLHDEGLAQRLLSVLSEKDMPTDFVIKYFDCVDLVIVYDQPFEKSLQQACIRDGQIRSKTETKTWIEAYVVGIEKLKKYALTIEKIKIVKPEDITNILKGIRYAAENN